jgi:hypothetical protein
MKALSRPGAGYNVQTAVNDHQIVLAGEIPAETSDFGQVEPMVNATLRELDRAGAAPGRRAGRRRSNSKTSDGS